MSFNAFHRWYDNQKEPFRFLIALSFVFLPFYVSIELATTHRIIALCCLLCWGPIALTRILYFSRRPLLVATAALVVAVVLSVVVLIHHVSRL
jgi:hypothetical protein